MSDDAVTFTKLQATFRDQPVETHPRHWDELWQQKVTPWDRQGPSLALKDAITNNPAIFGSPVHDSTTTSTGQQRKRALVPGCGRGYDVLLLASLGYDVYGLDVSASALEAARTLQQQVSSSSSDNSSSSTDAGRAYAAHDPQIGSGQTAFVHEDFFTDDFLAHTQGGAFDLIFDYTFLCALPPALRPAWARRHSKLLAPTGRLICLEWPLGKDARKGGPPHGLTSDLYVQLLRHPGREVAYDEAGNVRSDEGNGSVDPDEHALERVAHWKPARTHDAGKDSDYVSVWKHWKA